MKKTILALGLLSFLSLPAVNAAPLTDASSFDARHPVAPSTVSSELAAWVNAPLGDMWLHAPSTPEAWQKSQDDFARVQAQDTETLIEQCGVNVEHRTMAGVPVFVLTPPDLDPERADKVVLHLHGGGYVYGKGIGGTSEAVPLVAKSRVKVVSVDYRMPPRDPFPAAIDDAFAVYRALVKEVGAKNIAVMGTSTGGGMTLVLAIQAYRAGVEAPAALVAGTPWSDMTKTGDSYVANEYVDNVLGTWDGTLEGCAKLYAAGADRKDPLLSPVYASDDELRSFPPTLLVSGTRDLFLSNTVRMHVRLLDNQVPADLIVHEAQSHAQYYLPRNAPETARHYRYVEDFLAKTLFRTQTK